MCIFLIYQFAIKPHTSEIQAAHPLPEKKLSAPPPPPPRVEGNGGSVLHTQHPMSLLIIAIYFSFYHTLTNVVGFADCSIT